MIYKISLNRESNVTLQSIFKVGESKVSNIFRMITSKETGAVQALDDNQTKQQPEEEIENDKPVAKSLISLLNEEIEPVKWAVSSLLPEGATILAGAPKLGKSILSLNIALSVALGNSVLDSYNAEQGDVLYLALEDGKRRLQERVKDMDIPFTNSLPFDYETDWPNFDNGGLDRIEIWLKRNVQ